MRKREIASYTFISKIERDIYGHTYIQNKSKYKAEAYALRKKKKNHSLYFEILLILNEELLKKIQLFIVNNANKIISTSAFISSRKKLKN